MGRSSLWRACASALIALCTVAGCGYGGSASTKPAQDITVGLLVPLSGGYRDGGLEVQAGAQLAVDEINRAGGIKSLGGAKLKTVVVDSTTDQETAAASAASQLLNSKPAFIIGPPVSAVLLPASTVTEKAQVPMCTGAFSDSITQRGYRYIFQIPPKASVIGNDAVTAFDQVVNLVEPGATRVAVVYDSNPAQVLTVTFAKSLQATGKYQVVLNEQFPLGLTNAGPLAQKIKASGGQILVPGATVPELEQILGSLSSIGVSSLPIFNPGGGSPSTASYGVAMGRDVNGQFVLPLFDYDMKLSADQNKLLAAANKAYTARTKDAFMGQFAGEMYSCTYAMANAIDMAKSTDGAAIRQALVDHTFDSGPASLMPPGKVKFDQTGLNVDAVTLVSEWCDGLLQVVAPSQMAAMTARKPSDCGRT